MNLLVQNHNHYSTAKAIYYVEQEREIEGIYALLMIANKLETALYSAPTFPLASHTGISSCVHRQILTKCRKLVTMARMIKYNK